MEETKTNNKETAPVQATRRKQKQLIDFSSIYSTLILNWYWFLLSLIICVGAAAIYLRYQVPMYQASEKMLIKGNGNTSMSNPGVLGGVFSNAGDMSNELEILKTHSLAAQTVKDLKLNISYYSIGKVRDILLYKTQPISVDMDEVYLDKLNAPINLLIERQGNRYHVTGTYYVPKTESTFDGPYSINKVFSTLPATIGTKTGALKFTANSPSPMTEGQQMKVLIQSPKDASNKFVGEMTAGPSGGGGSIVQIGMTDENDQRAIDYIRQIVVSYNKQANDDKNEVAQRTEEFINDRLQKLNSELNNTEGQIASYKKRNGMVELKMNASQAMDNASTYEQKLNDYNTQVALLDEVSSYINNPNNRYQLMPVNVVGGGMADGLIGQYNSIVQKRNLLLQSASETSPVVMQLTTQLDQMMSYINKAMEQTRRGLERQRSTIASQYGRYVGQIGETPDQEHALTQIGRQQEVKSGLYLALLQKREDNSISMAAIADKGKIIDGPSFSGMIGPDRNRTLMEGALAGIAIPAVILLILQFFRYKIEGHNDVERLTNLPILADVALASDVAKTKADIVVHENKNNAMEEIFRSIRTNLQFMLAENEKVILCTSTTSGEGKTFISSNLAMSFALLGKKVLLVGLDIRKPRLAHLFGINDSSHGITNLLIKDNPTWEQVESQILPSGINNNLCLMPAGPVPPNPTELVARKSLEAIFSAMRDNFDYIIVDSAPAGIVTDTLTIARVCDVTIYMCRADFTPKESINIVNQLADEKKLPKVSIVLNGIDMSKKKYGYYYGYGRYGKYARYSHHSYKTYGTYGSYSYSSSNYSDKNDKSIKR